MSEESKAAKKQTTASFAKMVFPVLCVYFCISPDGMIMAALEPLAEAFPDLPFSSVMLISTIPALITIPASIIAGAIVGKKVRYKTLIVFSIALMIIAGTAGFFCDSYAMLIVTRVFFGIGIGCVYPLGNALALASFQGEQQAKVIGWGNSAMNIAVMILQLVCGFVTAINWHYAFLPHLILIIPLIFILITMKEPAEAVVTEEEKPKEKVHLPGAAWLIFALFLFCFIFQSTSLNVVGSVIAEKGLGNAAQAGMSLSIITLGGILVGLIYGSIEKLMKRWTWAFGMGVATIGFILQQGIIGGLAGVLIGSFLAGSGQVISLSGATFLLGRVCDDASFSVAVGVQGALMQGANFLSTFFVALVPAITGSEAMVTVLVAISICMFVLMIITLFCSSYIYKSRKDVSA